MIDRIKAECGEMKQDVFRMMFALLFRAALESSAEDKEEIGIIERIKIEYDELLRQQFDRTDRISGSSPIAAAYGKALLIDMRMGISRDHYGAVQSYGRVSLPAAIKDALSLKPQQQIALIKYKNHIKIMKKTSASSLNEKTEPSLRTPAALQGVFGVEQLGIKIDLEREELAGMEKNKWLRNHSLFNDYPPSINHYEESNAKIFATNIYRLQKSKIKASLFNFAKNIGKEEEILRQLMKRKAKKPLYPLIVWMARLKFVTQERQRNSGKLFAQLSVNDVHLIDLPLWPVNSEGNVLMDLMRWMLEKNKAPPFDYYKAKKASLRQLLSNVPSKPKQLPLFESLSSPIGENGYGSVFSAERNVGSLASRENEKIEPSPFSTSSSLELFEHVKALYQGMAINKPVYNQSEGERAPYTQMVEPTNAIIIIEGIFVLTNLPTNQLYDFKFFIDAPAPLRTNRGIQRYIEAFKLEDKEAAVLRNAIAVSSPLRDIRFCNRFTVASGYEIPAGADKSNKAGSASPILVPFTLDLETNILCPIFNDKIKQRAKKRLQDLRQAIKGSIKQTILEKVNIYIIGGFF